ncbi:MAG: hypothetical protein V7709_13630 [Halioglobus sp.]
MSHPRITFIINGTTYSLCASETQAMGNIPAADRGQLIALLEALKAQEISSQEPVEKAVNYAAQSASAATFNTAPVGQIQQQPKLERIGTGDVDALMARLVMEENQQKKQGLTKQGIYKGLAGFLALVVLLVMIL